jgi:hypothetical protein
MTSSHEAKDLILQTQDILITLNEKRHLSRNNKLNIPLININIASSNIYPCHSSEQDLTSGINNGSLRTGIVSVHQNNQQEAEVEIKFIKSNSSQNSSMNGDNDGFEPRCILQGFVDMNRCIDGDTVVIKYKSKDKWKSSLSELILTSQVENNQDDNTIEEEDDGASLSDVDKGNNNLIIDSNKNEILNIKSAIIPTASVVGILRRDVTEIM